MDAHPDRWSEDLALIRLAAAEAGKIAFGYFGQSPEVWWKNGDRSPVSAADFAANDKLLSMLLEARQTTAGFRKRRMTTSAAWDARRCSSSTPSMAPAPSLVARKLGVSP
jgi:hypothetical protein